MGDKHRSEFQKPVKNTLLSGASHGFPFESFQGSSLLIPVSQDSPSVLNDDVEDGKNVINRDLTHHDKLTQSQSEVMTTVEDQKNLQNVTNTSQSNSQGYGGIFSSFFGSGNQNKQDSDMGSSERKNSDQASLPQLSSTGSPAFVTMSNIQSFSPTLQVPSENTGIVQNNSSSYQIGFSHSKDSPFSHPQSTLNTVQDQNFEISGFHTSNPPGHLSFKPVEVPNAPVTSESSRPPEGGVQHFFSEKNNMGGSLEPNNQPLSSNIGFESFYNDPAQSNTTRNFLSKAQSSFDLPIRSESSENSSFYFNPSQTQNIDIKLYQTRAGSVDSFSYFQPPPLSTATPPLSSGVTSRNYRRDHHKRPTYAPVPGLTSNTTVSSSYLQPSVTFPNSSLSSSAITSSPPVKQPLAGSLSQPILNVPSVCSSSSNSSSSSTSVQSFLNLNPSEVQPAFSTVETTTNSSIMFHSSESDLKESSFISNPSPISVNNTINQTLTLTPSAPPTLGLTSMVSSVPLHPPIMSTKEHSVPPVDSNSLERSSPPIIPASFNNLANLGHSGIIYRPVYHHWFIKYETDSKETWQPFSMTDSLALEEAFNSPSLTADTVVPTDGGRYDVNVTSRTRTSVYWEETPKTVRRCSWFYKNTTDNRFRPYDENTAYNLEEEYKKAVSLNMWNTQVDLNNGEYVLMYGPNSFAHISKALQTPEGWEAEPDYSQSIQQRPRIVKRGVLDEFEIEDGESPNVDHLIFVVHGIGSICDLKFRKIEEAVDGFRSKALQLIKSHFRTSVEQGMVNRIEILPVSWHKHLHGETTGVDKKLQTITLKSIRRLRNFTNDTLLDILFYTSPVYCQTIMNQVGGEINSLLEEFKARNPNFNGGVSLVGHSLGSLILFDMLCHQKQIPSSLENIQEVTKTSSAESEIVSYELSDKKKRSLSRNVSYVMGTAGTGQPFIQYPKLSFQPLAFFALGSPIGMFVTVRGIDSLGLDFCLPTCSRFYNIFHPFDPVAYRIEGLINPELAEKRPVLIPHHKGRKRMHLELREKMVKVGAHLKQRLVDYARSTWNTVYQFTTLGRADDGLEQEVDQVIEKQLERQRTESVGISECEEADCDAGQLNMGRRIDHVLQEAPLESFNEYVSAITSHVIYWDSEDTMLLILKEIYGSMGINADSQSPASSIIPEDFVVSTGLDSNLPSTSTDYNDPSAHEFE